MIGNLPWLRLRDTAGSLDSSTVTDRVAIASHNTCDVRGPGVDRGSVAAFGELNPTSFRTGTGPELVSGRSQGTALSARWPWTPLDLLILPTSRCRRRLDRRSDDAMRQIAQSCSLVPTSLSALQSSARGSNCQDFNNDRWSGAAVRAID